jgi:hypothetical protein
MEWLRRWAAKAGALGCSDGARAPGGRVVLAGLGARRSFQERTGLGRVLGGGAGRKLGSRGPKAGLCWSTRLAGVGSELLSQPDVKIPFC